MDRLEEAIAELRRRWNDFYDTVERPLACLFCAAAHIVWNGCRVRAASVRILGQVVHLDEVRCRRVRCQSCKRSWTLRPEGLVPHKHYQAEVVAHAVGMRLYEHGASQAAVAASVGCSRRQVARWVHWVAGLAEPTELERRIAHVSGAPLLARLRTVAGLATKALTEARRILLGRAAQVLGLLEVLGTALGLEPPGLAAMLARWVGDRTGVVTYARPAIPEVARSAPPAA